MKKKELINKIIDEQKYSIMDNMFTFIQKNNKRPEWSKKLNDLLISNNYDLDLSNKFDDFNEATKTNRNLRKVYKFISEKNGVKIDLASGPS